MNHMIDTNKLKSQITEEEWKLRLDLAATYRLIALYGWDDLIYTHVSLRIPGPEHHFLINPFGLNNILAALCENSSSIEFIYFLFHSCEASNIINTIFCLFGLIIPFLTN